MKKLYLLLSISILFYNLSIAQDAIYKIEFISNWTSAAHPTDYPTNSAHFSPLIGMTHKDAAPFFQLGELASDGVEQVAETGGTSMITAEINAVITSGNAYEIINGSGLGSGSGTITIDNVNVDANFPYISLITMIAPSPDWVVQISNQKLTEANDDWKTTISVDVYATDVGTDSGTTYTSDNANTNPAQNISSLENIAPFSDKIVGTFKLTLQQVLDVDENALQYAVTIYPNPSLGKVFINNVGSVALKNAVIYDITGKKVKEFNQITNQKSLSFGSLRSGLYLLKLNSDKSSITKKLIIQ